MTQFTIGARWTAHSAPLFLEWAEQGWNDILFARGRRPPSLLHLAKLNERRLQGQRNELKFLTKFNGTAISNKLSTWKKITKKTPQNALFLRFLLIFVFFFFRHSWRLCSKIKIVKFRGFFFFWALRNPEFSWRTIKKLCWTKKFATILSHDFHRIFFLVPLFCT